MKPNPETLIIMGIPFKMIYCDDIADVAPDKRSISFGHSSLETRTIRIFSGNGDEFTWQTIMHEVFHMIGDLTNIQMQKMNTEQNHNELDCFANVLTDTLFRNNLLRIDAMK